MIKMIVEMRKERLLTKYGFHRDCKIGFDYWDGTIACLEADWVKTINGKKYYINLENDYSYSELKDLIIEYEDYIKKEQEGKEDE